jgi:hypothetical protein
MAEWKVGQHSGLSFPLRGKTVCFCREKQPIIPFCVYGGNLITFQCSNWFMCCLECVYLTLFNTFDIRMTMRKTGNRAANCLMLNLNKQTVVWFFARSSTTDY